MDQDDEIDHILGEAGINEILRALPDVSPEFRGIVRTSTNKLPSVGSHEELSAEQDSTPQAFFNFPTTHRPRKH